VFVEEQLPVASCQSSVASRRVLAGGWSAPTTGNRSQVLIPEYFTRNYRGINILRGNAQDVQNMGLAARLKYNGLNILQARY
jgi:hypothetical protein